MPFWVSRPVPHPYPDVPVQNPVASFQVLGPFHIAHDDDDIDSDGAVAVALEQGAIVLLAWAEITEEWTFDASGFLALVLSLDSDPGTSRRLTRYDTTSGDVVPVVAEGVEARNGDLNVAPVHSIARVIEPSTLRVILDGGPASTGEADVYALIAESA